MAEDAYSCTNWLSMKSSIVVLAAENNKFVEESNEAVECMSMKLFAATDIAISVDAYYIILKIY